MDKLDYSILKALQNDFPLTQMPYDILAEKLQIPCTQLLSRIQKMSDKRIIRRIGVSLDSKKLGYCSTLAALAVPSELIKEAAELIDQFPEVTHCYLREGDFNIWFTIIAVDNHRIDCILAKIRCCLSLEDAQILNLPTKRLYKLDARFNTIS